MKRILFILFLLPFISKAQLCSDIDTVLSARTSSVGFSTATVTGVAGGSAGISWTLKYVRVGHTDTVTTSSSSITKNLTGLTPNTQYTFRYTTFCGTGYAYNLGRKYFTTTTNSVAYTPMTDAGYQFKGGKFDSSFALPFRDTSNGRWTTRPGTLVCNYLDSNLYRWTGLKWSAVAIDSLGIVDRLNHKVDSVTIASDSLFYWINGTGYGQVFSASGWGTSGNAGTDPASNFLGTTDANGLMFKINNTRAGYIEYGTANLSMGVNAMVGNISGTENSAFGYATIQNNTTGSFNSAIGNSSLAANTTGSSNTANGFGALNLNTTGSYNSATGYASLTINNGSRNVAIGSYAGYYNTTVSDQLFINNFNTGNYTNDVSKSLVYGLFNSTTNSQQFRINGQLKLVNGTQSNGYILSSDANGLSSWVAPSTITGSYLPLAGGTLTGNLLFSADNTKDIGASGATRPRTGYFGTSLISPLLIGGTGTTSSLTLQPTSGIGTTNSDIIFNVGNNGGTLVAKMFSDGYTTFGSTTNYGEKLAVVGTYYGTGRMKVDNYGAFQSGVYAGGTNVPLARVHIAAGSAAVNTAPLKFTSGAYLSTDETGTIQFLSGKFKITDSVVIGGNVGIGTTSPVATLHIKSGISYPFIIQNAGGGNLFYVDNGGAGYFTTGMDFGSGTAHFGTSYNQIGNYSGGTTALVIVANGSTARTLDLKAGSGTADIQQWQNSSGTALSVMNYQGKLGVLNTAPDSAITTTSLHATTNVKFDGKTNMAGAQYVGVNIISDANYTISTTDYIISCQNWTTDHRITLPDPATNTGRVLIFTNYGGAGRYSFSRDITQVDNSVITSASNIAIGFQIVSDGTVWQVTLTGTVF